MVETSNLIHSENQNLPVNKKKLRNYSLLAILLLLLSLVLDIVSLSLAADIHVKKKSDYDVIHRGQNYTDIESTAAVATDEDQFVTNNLNYSFSTTIKVDDDGQRKNKSSTSELGGGERHGKSKQGAVIGLVSILACAILIFIPCYTAIKKAQARIASYIPFFIGFFHLVPFAVELTLYLSHAEKGRTFMMGHKLAILLCLTLSTLFLWNSSYAISIFNDRRAHAARVDFQNHPEQLRKHGQSPDYTKHEQSLTGMPIENFDSMNFHTPAPGLFTAGSPNSGFSGASHHGKE